MFISTCQTSCWSFPEVGRKSWGIKDVTVSRVGERQKNIMPLLHKFSNDLHWNNLRHKLMISVKHSDMSIAYWKVWLEDQDSYICLVPLAESVYTICSDYVYYINRKIRKKKIVLFFYRKIKLKPREFDKIVSSKRKSSQVRHT